MRHLSACLVISLCAFYGFCASAAENTGKRFGKISGVVVDKSTQQPLVGVNVSVIDTKWLAVTDNQGRFVIPNLPVGTYQLQAARIGYETLAKTDVVVSTGRTVQVVIQLKEALFQLEGETAVQADYFYKDPEVSTSLHTFDREEIRRAPGSVEDINRVMMSMPGVASTTDQINALVVRGGNPIENLTLYDNIELPNANHFGEHGGTGGPIGMINVDFIREANFYTGGFPAKYGDKLSSVLDIKLREGNRKEIATDIDLGMAGVGGILEGPLVKGKGAWLLSYRKSYLDLIKGPVGLTAVPQYSDVQGKMVYEVTPKHKLSLIGIGGIDHINITESEDVYSQGVDWVLNDNKRYGVGVNWQALFSGKGYALLTLSQTFDKFLVDVRDNDGSQTFLDKSWERETTFKGALHYNFNSGNQFTAGFQAMGVNFRHNIWSKDWEFYSDEADAVITLPGRRLDEEVQSYKTAAYLHHNWAPSERLNVKGGLRFDYFGYTQAKNLSPRFGLSYELMPKTTLNTSFGFFYQAPPYVLLTADDQNRKLKNLHANHYVIGLERLFRNDLKFTLEFYNKDYDDYPIRQSDATRIHVNDGEGYVRGVDIFLQKKLSGGLYGLVSYSYARARAKTPKTGEFDWDYDYRHIFTLITGYRLSDKWEISGKWRYMGGRPYTPIIDSFELAPGDWEPIYDEKYPNTERYPPYHRLDIRFDRRFHFKSWNLTTYFEVENIYNRRNIWTYRWNRDERKNDEVYQFGFFPVGGFRVEF